MTYKPEILKEASARLHALSITSSNPPTRDLLLHDGIEEAIVHISDLETRLANVTAVIADITRTQEHYEQKLSEAKAQRDKRVYELTEVAYLAQLREDMKALSTPAPSLESLVREKAKPLIEAVEKLRGFFTSGNDIPVERATIKAELWKEIDEALRQFGKEGEKHKHHPVIDEDNPSHTCCQNCGEVRKEGV